MAAVTRLLSGIWVVLELLVPRPLGALLLRYWTVLPVLCGVLIAVAGWALQIEPALRIGAILIVAGLFARLMLDLARSFMRQPTLVAALTGAGSLLAAALLLLALLGLVEIEVHQPLADVRTWVLTHSARK
jgi:hypothetical protein